jgi:hypothetical protein
VSPVRIRYTRCKVRLTARLQLHARGKPATLVDLAVFANDWARTCDVCGGPQRLELRFVQGVVRDQPRCAKCRHAKLGPPRRKGTGEASSQLDMFGVEKGA